MAIFSGALFLAIAKSFTDDDLKVIIKSGTKELLEIAGVISAIVFISVCAAFMGLMNDMNLTHISVLMIIASVLTKVSAIQQDHAVKRLDLVSEFTLSWGFLSVI